MPNPSELERVRLEDEITQKNYEKLHEAAFSEKLFTRREAMFVRVERAALQDVLYDYKAAKDLNERYEQNGTSL